MWKINDEEAENYGSIINFKIQRFVCFKVRTCQSKACIIRILLTRVCALESPIIFHFRAFQGSSRLSTMNEATGDEMEDLRKALQLAVCKIIFEEDREQGTRATQSAIAAMTELTFQYATQSLIPDLYTFSTHANRKSTICPDDVAVALRKLQPDQLEAFKRNFCRSGSKISSSKNNTTVSYNANEENSKIKATSVGRRRKRNEAEVLSLSASSSSSEDHECVDNNMTDRKRKTASHMRTSILSTTHRSRSNASSLPTKTNTTGRKITQRESLLNKFQLQSEPNSYTNNKDAFYYDTSSTDDDDIARSPSRGLGMTKTARSKAAVAATTAKKSIIPQKFSLQGIQIRKSNDVLQGNKRSKSNSHSKNDTLLDDDDDSTDDDDIIFMNRNTNTTKKKTDIENDRPVANHSSDPEHSIYSKPDRNEIQNLDDDDHSETWDDHHGNARNDGDDDIIDRGAPKQSQVAEALANLSSDSGMDEDDSEDEVQIRVNAGKSESNSRHRPLIESDDDD
jgi:hypothetical protein